MEISILSISARSGGEEAEISFLLTDGNSEHSDRQSFIIPMNQYLTMCLEVGVVDSDTYDDVQRASQIWDAAKRGIYILGYGSCSERSLKMKLVMKGYDKDIAEEAVSYIASKGLIRENDDALRSAERMLSKLWGKKRIAAGLYEKGYSADSVNFALNTLEDRDIDYVNNCRRLIHSKYYDSIKDRDSYSKVFAALMRYGYTSSEIKQAISIIDD